MGRNFITRAKKADDKTSVVIGVTKTPTSFQADAERTMSYSQG